MKFFKPLKTEKGFTLIELLVVIAIIGILVTIVVVAINPARVINDSKDSKRRSDLNQIKAAMQLYYNDCKDYPPSIPLGGQFGNDNPATADTCDDSSIYMRQVPNDTGGSYRYVRVDTNNYYIVADLFNPSAEDGNTITKCAIPGGELPRDFAVCND